MRFFKGKQFKVMGADWQVYPLGLKQAPEFLTNLANIISQIGGVNLAFKDGELDINDKKNQQMMLSLMPMLINSSMNLFYKCVSGKYEDPETGETVDVSDRVGDLPHDEAVPLIEHWAEESFGSAKKIKPWMSLIDNLVSRVSGEPFSISGLASKGSSKTDTREKTSLNVNEMDGPMKESAIQNS